MNLIRRWREKWCDSYIRKNAPERRSWRFVDYDKARYVGILFDCTKMEDRNQILAFAKGLEEQGKSIKLLGYYDDRPNREMHLPFSFYSQKDLRPNFVAKSNYIERFLDKPFDILMTVYHGDSYPIKTISALSRAKIRLGPLNDNARCFDIMVDIKKPSGYKTTLEEYIRILQQMVQKNVFVEL